MLLMLSPRGMAFSYYVPPAAQAITSLAVPTRPLGKKITTRMNKNPSHGQVLPPVAQDEYEPRESLGHHGEKKRPSPRNENKAGATATTPLIPTAGSGGEEYKPTIDDVSAFFINGLVNSGPVLDVAHLS